MRRTPEELNHDATLIPLNQLVADLYPRPSRPPRLDGNGGNRLGLVAFSLAEKSDPGHRVGCARATPNVDRPPPATAAIAVASVSGIDGPFSSVLVERSRSSTTGARIGWPKQGPTTSAISFVSGWIRSELAAACLPW